jgi:hypothetical protein
MSTTNWLTVLPLALFLGIAACKTPPAPAEAQLMPMPMPMGEIKAPTPDTRATVSFEPTAMSYVQTDWLVDQIVAGANTPSRVRIALVYSVEFGNELLAEECVRTNWVEACEIAQALATDPTSVGGRPQTPEQFQLWENQLRQRFTDTLFPCHNGRPLANVSAIVHRVLPAN